MPLQPEKLALALRQSLVEYGNSQKLSINTVRSQLRSAASRIGVKPQADLVRTVWKEVLLPDMTLPPSAAGTLRRPGSHRCRRS